MTPGFSRRLFLAGSGALAAASLLGCGGGGNGGGPRSAPTVAYKLSGRGRRVSNAARSHNANKVFASPAAALAGRAHAGDTSKVVSIDVGATRWGAWFGDGRQVVDLRQVV